MILAAMVAFIYSVTDGYRSKQLRFIPYYTMTSLLDGLSGFCVNYIIKDHRINVLVSKLSAVLFILFLLLEFIFLTNFLLHTIISKRKRRIARIAAVIFTLSLVPAFVYNRYYATNSFGIPILPMESIFLISLCLLYVYELFQFPLPGSFRSRPAFWVVAGIMLYHSCSIPLFLLTSIIRREFPANEYSAFYSINDILYGIFFIMLIRACTLVPKESSG